MEILCAWQHIAIIKVMASKNLHFISGRDGQLETLVPLPRYEVCKKIRLNFNIFGETDKRLLEDSEGCSENQQHSGLLYSTLEHVELLELQWFRRNYCIGTKKNRNGSFMEESSKVVSIICIYDHASMLLQYCTVLYVHIVSTLYPDSPFGLTYNFFAFLFLE